MGTIQCKVILDRADKTLFDETNVHWSASELLDYFNAGINATVANKPDAYTQRGNITLVAGTVQTVPSGGTQIIDIIRNANNRSVTQKDRNALDHSSESWHGLSQTADILHWCYDDRDPESFLVYPPAINATTVYGRWSARPTRITAETDTFPLSDIYESALHFWTVGMALMRTSKRGDMMKGQAWLTLWVNAIGARAQVQQMFAPLPPEETADSRRSEEG